MAQNPRTSETESTPTASRNNDLTRRNYVRSLAAVATATAAIGGTGAAAAQAEDDYEVIEAQGQSITVASGETLENKLFDMTTGQDITISAQGSDWTIRNVGFKGKNTADTGSATFGIADTGNGTSTIENVYLGDGATDGNASSSGHGQTAFWVSPSHTGHIDIENANIQNFPDNAVYGSAPGKEGAGGGTVHVDSSFAANCYVAHFRLGSEGSKVTNSSVYVDGGNGYVGRGIWGWAPGQIEVEGCEIEMNGHHTAIDAGANGRATEVLVEDSNYDEGNGIAESAGSNVELGENVGTDPEAVIPDGVPTSPEEAASGDEN